MDNKDQINQEAKIRFKNYESRGHVYTNRTYSHKARKLYAQLRTDKISECLKMYLKTSSIPKILDIGCGTGIFLDQLAKKRNDLKLFGIDFSNTMLIEAKNLSIQENLKFNLLRASAFELPFTNNLFDAIIATRFIHQYSDNLKEKLISEMKRCLSPNGIAIVEFYSIFPRLSRYLFKVQVAGKSLKENLKHCPTRRTVNRITGGKYKIIPLLPPGSTKIEKLIGSKGLVILRKFLVYFRMNFIFDQYLIVIKKNRI